MFEEVPCRLFESGTNGPIAIFANENSSQRLSEMPFVLRGHRKFTIARKIFWELAGEFDMFDQMPMDLEEVHVIATKLGRGPRDDEVLAWSTDNGWFTVVPDSTLIWDERIGPEVEYPSSITLMGDEQAFDWLESTCCFTSCAWPVLFDAYAELGPLAQKAVDKGILYSDGSHPAHIMLKKREALRNLAATEQTYRSVDVAKIFSVSKQAVTNWRARANDWYPKEKRAKASEWREFIRKAWPDGKYDSNKIDL